MPYAVAPAEPPRPRLARRTPTAVGGARHRVDRRQVRHSPAGQHPPGRAGRRVALARRRSPRGRRVRRRTAHGSYEALVADPEVDVVYVATPHHLHLPHALLAIEAGKHVLVEKPVGLDAGEARVIGEAARRAGVFCMEAMWTPLPAPLRHRAPAPRRRGGRRAAGGARRHGGVVRRLPPHHAPRARRWPVARPRHLPGHPCHVGARGTGPGGRRRYPCAERHQRPADDGARHGVRRHGIPDGDACSATPPRRRASPATDGRIDLGGPVLPARARCRCGCATAPTCSGTSPGSTTPPSTSRRPRWRGGSRPARPGSPLRPWADTVATLEVMDRVREAVDSRAVRLAVARAAARLAEADFGPGRPRGALRSGRATSSARPSSPRAARCPGAGGPRPCWAARARRPSSRPRPPAWRGSR